MNPDRDLRIGADFERVLNDITGHLLWQAEMKKARDAAESFADRLTWLSGAERQDVVRVYTADRLEMTRAVLLRIADRTLDLRGEYQARYRTLRVRLFAASLSITAVAVAVVWLTSPVNLA